MYPSIPSRFLQKGKNTKRDTKTTMRYCTQDLFFSHIFFYVYLTYFNFKRSEDVERITYRKWILLIPRSVYLLETNMVYVRTSHSVVICDVYISCCTNKINYYKKLIKMKQFIKNLHRTILLSL